MHFYFECSGIVICFYSNKLNKYTYISNFEDMTLVCKHLLCIFDVSPCISNKPFEMYLFSVVILQCLIMLTIIL